jgi:hypothetical protein
LSAIISAILPLLFTSTKRMNNHWLAVWVDTFHVWGILGRVPEATNFMYKYGFENKVKLSKVIIILKTQEKSNNFKH